MASNNDEGVPELGEDELWILVDEPPAAEGELARFWGRRKYSVDTLGENLQSLTEKISRALGNVTPLGHGFELDEISIDARLSAEVGFELIAKAGVEGGITLTFRRAPARGGVAT